MTEPKTLPRSWGSGPRRLGLALAGVLIASLALVAAPPPVSAAAGGPVVLMGIDAEDGGPGGHGAITVYQNLVANIVAQVTNSGSGILVVGGGKNVGTPDNVTAFWNAIDTASPESVTYVNNLTMADAIATRSFSGFKMLAVVSDVGQTSSGGLTAAEHGAITGRQADVANFVNNGGALLGFSSVATTTPSAPAFGYVSALGSITATSVDDYSDVTSTTAGQDLGIDDMNLDVSAWHNEFGAFPSFLSVLVTNSSTGNPAALGGRVVVIEPPPPPADPPSPDTRTAECTPGASCTASPPPGTEAAFTVTAAGGDANATLVAKRVTVGQSTAGTIGAAGPISAPTCGIKGSGASDLSGDFIQFGFTDPVAGGKFRKRITETSLTPTSKQKARKLAGDRGVCFAAPYKFQVEKKLKLFKGRGDDGKREYQGFIRDCDDLRKGEDAPSRSKRARVCITERAIVQKDAGWVVQISYRVPPADQDPKGRTSRGKRK